MKKFALLFVGLLTCLSFAAAPTAPTLYGPLKWIGVIGDNIWATGNSQGKSSTGRDSLVGADTIYLVNKLPFSSGSYVLNIKDSLGLADTVKIYQVVYGNDASTIISESSIDTLKGSASAYASQSIQLTAGLTYFGSRVSVYAIKWIATLKTKIYRSSLFQVKSDR